MRGSAAQTITLDDPRLSSDAKRVPGGFRLAVPTLRLRYGDKLTVRDIDLPQAGTYAVSFIYDNHVGLLSAGVTNGVKQLTITGPDGTHRAIVQLPHVNRDGKGHGPQPSTRAYMELKPGRYQLDLGDFINMSALESNALYTRHGGKKRPINDTRIARDAPFRLWSAKWD